MAAQFKLRCFDDTITKYILIGANILLAILGVIHWGCTVVSIKIVGLVNK